MKSKKRKQRFTRAEVVAALVAKYRVEQDRYHELAADIQKAALRGEAAEYSRLEDKSRLQEERLLGMMRMVTALGIETAEFMEAVNQYERPGP